MVATVIQSKIEDFRPHVPMIQGLRSPGMRSRHWQMLSELIQVRVKPKATLTFSRCLELGLQNHVDDIARVAETAEKEYAIEQVHLTRNLMQCICRWLLFRAPSHSGPGKDGAGVVEGLL